MNNRREPGGHHAKTRTDRGNDWAGWYGLTARTKTGVWLLPNWISETATSLVAWLANAINVGQKDLSAAAQEDAPGEAPVSNPNLSPG